jgi:hypothetical protein
MPDRDYSGTPLHRKLGIREGSAVALLDAPEGFGELLEPLPGGVELRRAARGPVDVVVLFATSRARLARRFPAAKGAIGADGGIWVAWPKKTAGLATDLDFGFVQQVGLDAGLVDNKTAAIDATWTSVRFVVRLADRPTWPRPERAATGPGGGAGPSPAA